MIERTYKLQSFPYILCLFRSKIKGTRTAYCKGREKERKRDEEIEIEIETERKRERVKKRDSEKGR